MTTCSTCNDTHRMSLGDREVLCTRCPTPCWDCGKGGPFCLSTPCPCWCHRGPKCGLCGEWLGREKGTHYNCRVAAQYRLDALGSCLRDVALIDRGFNLGRFAGLYDADSWHRPRPWEPGHGLSADHDCTDCGAPMLTSDAAQGYRTCNSCAADRRDAR